MLFFYKITEPLYPAHPDRYTLWIAASAHASCFSIL